MSSTLLQALGSMSRLLAGLSSLGAGFLTIGEGFFNLITWISSIMPWCPTREKTHQTYCSMDCIADCMHVRHVIENNCKCLRAVTERDGIRWEDRLQPPLAVKQVTEMEEPNPLSPVEAMASPNKSCCICIGEYNETTKKPLILECGHTICKSCLDEIAFAEDDERACPICRHEWGNTLVEELPLCYQLLPEEGWTCSSHKYQMTFWCPTCSQKLCKQCLKEDHKRCDWILMEEKVALVKTEFTDKYLKTKSSFEEKNTNIERALKENKVILDAARNLNRGLATVELNYAGYQQRIILLQAKLRKKHTEIEKLKNILEVPHGSDILSTYQKKTVDLDKTLEGNDWPFKPELTFMKKVFDNYQSTKGQPFNLFDICRGLSPSGSESGFEASEDEATSAVQQNNEILVAEASVTAILSNNVNTNQETVITQALTNSVENSNATTVANASEAMEIDSTNVTTNNSAAQTLSIIAAIDVNTLGSIISTNNTETQQAPNNDVSTSNLENIPNSQQTAISATSENNQGVSSGTPTAQAVTSGAEEISSTQQDSADVTLLAGGNTNNLQTNPTSSSMNSEIKFEDVANGSSSQNNSYEALTFSEAVLKYLSDKGPVENHFHFRIRKKHTNDSQASSDEIQSSFLETDLTENTPTLQVGHELQPFSLNVSNASTSASEITLGLTQLQSTSSSVTISGEHASTDGPTTISKTPAQNAHSNQTISIPTNIFIGGSQSTSTLSSTPLGASGLSFGTLPAQFESTNQTSTSTNTMIGDNISNGATEAQTTMLNPITTTAEPRTLGTGVFEFGITQTTKAEVQVTSITGTANIGQDLITTSINQSQQQSMDQTNTTMSMNSLSEPIFTFASINSNSPTVQCGSLSQTNTSKGSYTFTGPVLSSKASLLSSPLTFNNAQLLLQDDDSNIENPRKKATSDMEDRAEIYSTSEDSDGENESENEEHPRPVEMPSAPQSVQAEISSATNNLTNGIRFGTILPLHTISPGRRIEETGTNAVQEIQEQQSIHISSTATSNAGNTIQINTSIVNSNSQIEVGATADSSTSGYGDKENQEPTNPSEPINGAEAMVRPDSSMEANVQAGSYNSDVSMASVVDISVRPKEKKSANSALGINEGASSSTSSPSMWTFKKDSNSSPVFHLGRVSGGRGSRGKIRTETVKLAEAGPDGGKPCHGVAFKYLRSKLSNAVNNLRRSSLRRGGPFLKRTRGSLGRVLGNKNR